MAQVTYTKENDKWYADFDNRKKTLWKERWISPIDMPEPTPSVEKGQIINIDMTGSGTPQQYRVIKVNENVVEVLSLSDATNLNFGNNRDYANSTLDTYCNTTWYNALSATAKEAIVDKTFRQDNWYYNTSGNPIYQAKYNGDVAYQISLANAAIGTEISRHVYVISVQDIIDYLEVTPTMTQTDTTLTYTNLWQQFWNDSVAHSGQYIWLRSAFATSAGSAFVVNGEYGLLGNYSIVNNIIVRPAFQIDLTKIEWTPVE